jgi:hypothetical protein
MAMYFLKLNFIIFKILSIFIYAKKNDCGDLSDETTNCPEQPFRCPSNQIQCTDTTMNICINRTQLCDNIKVIFTYRIESA